MQLGEIFHGHSYFKDVTTVADRMEKRENDEESVKDEQRDQEAKTDGAEGSCSFAKARSSGQNT